jgi:nitrous oxidase accessory protein NosD
VRKAAVLFILILLIFGTFVFASNIQPVRTEPTTITVPDDYLTIQEAINAASSGDTIFVKNGTYNENLITYKTLSLIGEDRNTTIIDGNRNGSCIYIGAENVKVEGFTIKNSGLNFDWYNPGIFVSTYGANITNNIIRENAPGIVLSLANNSFVGHNIFVNNSWWAIQVFWSANVVMTSNFIEDTCRWDCSECGVYAIQVSPSSYNNTISHNIIRNSLGAVSVVENSTFNKIISNRISNVSYGILAGIPALNWISEGNNTVKGNIVSDCKFSIIAGTRGNHIYHNGFLSDYNQSYAFPGFNSSWDDGYPSGGNYWSDYNGTDFYSGPYQNETGSDGIGDTPYFIDENNTDYYPLMGPWTGTGGNVTVVYGSGVSLTFGNVTSSGITTINETLIGPAPPSGFTLAMEPPMYYDVKTSANYTGIITISIPYNDTGMTEEEESTLKLMHWNETEQQWINITISVDIENNVIVGETTGLSYFGLMTTSVFPWDVTGDGYAGIDDIVLVAEHFGENPGNPQWNSKYDVTGDDYVGIADIVEVAEHFGESI